MSPPKVRAMNQRSFTLALSIGSICPFKYSVFRPTRCGGLRPLGDRGEINN